MSICNQAAWRAFLGFQYRVEGQCVCLVKRLLTSYVAALLLLTEGT